MSLFAFPRYCTIVLSLLPGRGALALIVSHRSSVLVCVTSAGVWRRRNDGDRPHSLISILGIANRESMIEKERCSCSLMHIRGIWECLHEHSRMCHQCKAWKGSPATLKRKVLLRMEDEYTAEDLDRS